jgi:hypothetical protein
MSSPPTVDPPWIPCQFLRHAGRNACVIRLDDTGAILQIGLSSPIDVTRACMICALKPVPARIRWGEGGAHEGCELAIEWPVPPPVRFVRKKTTYTRKPHKRQRT